MREPVSDCLVVRVTIRLKEERSVSFFFSVF